MNLKRGIIALLAGLIMSLTMGLNGNASEIEISSDVKEELIGLGKKYEPDITSLGSDFLINKDFEDATYISIRFVAPEYPADLLIDIPKEELSVESLKELEKVKSRENVDDNEINANKNEVISMNRMSGKFELSERAEAEIFGIVKNEDKQIIGIDFSPNGKRNSSYNKNKNYISVAFVLEEKEESPTVLNISKDSLTSGTLAEFSSWKEAQNTLDYLTPFELAYLIMIALFVTGFIYIFWIN